MTLDPTLAVCVAVDPEVFFPDPSDRPGIEHAKSYCRTCPVTAECLTESFDLDARYGIWGGLAEDERWRIRAQQPAPTRSGRGTAQCGTTSGYQRHRYLGEPTCPPCRAAQAEAQRNYLKSKRTEAAS